MATTIAMLLALLVMIVVYEMMPVATSVRSRQFDIIRGAARHDDNLGLPFWRLALKPLGSLVEQFLPRGLREKVRQKLYWANFAGSWTGWNEVEFWSLSIAAAAVAFVFGIKNPITGLMGAGIAGLIPYAFLTRDARKIERAMGREMPDALYLLAATMTVGVTLPDALRELADFESTFSNWVRLTISKSHGGNLIAALRAEAEGSAMPRLMALATKLELIETKGAAGSVTLLRQLADDQANDYRQAAERRAKELGTELMFPILGCFFFPYLIVIAAPLFANIFSLFARAM
jgi:Flp pilus assembly protein TadB